ncbi:MAG: hypothetical protein PWP23_1468 [Candidatus Sumerlaeota bacterium]|nr:hypothetical protein [Candidatus Sumerlaeota bacterium]
MNLLSANTAARPLIIRDLPDLSVLASLCDHTDLWALPTEQNSAYIVGFAASRRCVEFALRLRYEVFNLELHEGLSFSHITGLDKDEFDDQMTHLVVLERRTHRIIGTYRLQTGWQALSSGGFYSAREYDLSGLQPLLNQIVECGRACIDQNHRSITVLSLLWKGLAAFMRYHEHRWLFGCCSLTSQNADDGWRAMKTIRSQGYIHPTLYLPACPGFSCGPVSRENDPALGPAIKLPKLFAAYMRLGAQVISEPALDRDFGTVDFLILYDVKKANLKNVLTGFLPQRLGELGLDK